MYEIALTVAACLRSGTRVDVAWVVETDLAPAGGVPVDSSGAVALTPGGGRVGSLYGGALDQQLAERAQTLGDRGRLVPLQVRDLEAEAFGLAGARHGDRGGLSHQAVARRALEPAAGARPGHARPRAGG